METDKELEAIVLRDARGRVAAMVHALEGARPRDVADALWREAHTLVGLASTMGDEALARSVRVLAHRLRDEFGKTTALTPAEEDTVRSEVAQLSAAIAARDQP